MRARTGAMVLVGTAMVLLLHGLPWSFMLGVEDGAGDRNTSGAASGDIGAAAGGGEASATGTRSAEGGGAEGSGAALGADDAPRATDAPPTGGGADGVPIAPGATGDAVAAAAAPATTRDGVGASPRSAAMSAPPVAGGDAAPTVRTVERERILVLGSVFFPSGQAELGPDARRLLDGVAATYKGTTQRLEITGHTDTRGSAAVNASLSRARAEAVRGYLAARGIPARQLVVRYAGASRPMARGASSEDNAQNRRVELSVAASP